MSYPVVDDSITRAVFYAQDNWDGMCLNLLWSAYWMVVGWFVSRAVWRRVAASSSSCTQQSRRCLVSPEHPVRVVKAGLAFETKQGE